MTNATMKSAAGAADIPAFRRLVRPDRDGVRDRVRGLIEEMMQQELDAVLARPRYGRRAKDAEDEAAPPVAAGRHGSRVRTLTGTFGKTEITVPRARLNTADGKTTEWKSQALRAYQRRTRAADALIAGAYLSGTNTRRVRRALVAVFRGAVSKDTVSRVWRKVRGDWEAWNARSLAEEPIVRLILDGTVVRVRLDKKATAISLLVVLGVREDGQKVLLAVQNMGGETQEAWRAVLDDLVKRGLRKPALLIVDGGAGLDAALTALWGDVPTQRCTVHKHRNLLAHAPERLHEEITADYTDMIYAETPRRSEAAPSLPAQVAAAPPRRRRQPGRGRRSPLHFHHAAAEPMEERTNHQCHRTPARRVQTPHQNPDRAAIRRHGGHAVLGAAGIGTDRHAQSRWLANPCQQTCRSNH